ncbi:MAG TPA: hypothetical protein VG675_24000 [Bryobacteraceae bacterium]|nr:hypothetical protein [Bryobacteraceae bacterium]
MAACGRHAPSYPVPPQFESSLGLDPGELRPAVQMDDADADRYIVRDISPEPLALRWAFLHPELRLQVENAEHLKFYMEFVVPDVTFRETGPVVVSCSINGKLLGSVRCPHPGRYRFEKPVPPGLVKERVPVTVSANAEPRYVAKADKAQLSFLLAGAGFIQ